MEMIIMHDTPILTGVNQLAFEDAMNELEKIVRQLEEGRIPLQEAVRYYERGSMLKSHCETLLKEARLKIDEIIQNEQGDVTAKPSSLEQFHGVKGD